MRIDFEIFGDKQVSRKLLRVADYAGDASPALERVADLLMQETRLQFDTEGGHASGGWKELKPATVKAKAKASKGLDPRILHATGLLERSLTDRGDTNQVLDVRPDGLDFGSTLVYAGAHQNPRPGSRLPQRRPVELTEAARRNVVRILQAHILGSGA